MLRVGHVDASCLVDCNTKWLEADRPGVRGLKSRVPAFNATVLPVCDEEAPVRREREHHRLSKTAEVGGAPTDHTHQRSISSNDQNAIAAGVGGIQLPGLVDSETVQAVRAERFETQCV